MTETVRLTAFRVTGIGVKTAPMGHPGYDPDAIPAIWRKLMENEAAMRLVRGPMYGVGKVDPATGDLWYIAGFETEETVPGFEVMEIPSGEYFVVPHHGPISNYGKTLENFFQHTVPLEGLTLADGPFIEKYTEDYAGESADSQFDTYFLAK